MWFAWCTGSSPKQKTGNHRADRKIKADGAMCQNVTHQRELGRVSVDVLEGSYRAPR